VEEVISNQFGKFVTRTAWAGAVPHSMKLRKRDKIVVLFWVPFWTLTAAFVAGIGWMVGLVHLP